MENTKVILMWNGAQIGVCEKEFESEYLLCTAIEKSMKTLGQACQMSIKKIKARDDLKNGFMDIDGHIDVKIIYNDDILLETKAKGKPSNFDKVPYLIEGLSVGIVKSLKQMIKLKDMSDDLFDDLTQHDREMKRITGKRLDN